MKIFYHKHGRGSRIAFAETMCLPEIAAKLCQMPYNIVDVHTIVVELFFLLYVKGQVRAYSGEARIKYSLPTEYPFFLGDVVVAYHARMTVNAREQMPVDADVFLMIADANIRHNPNRNKIIPHIFVITHFLS